MKKIDIETIYPQEEKDREGEKLKKLCDIYEGQKNLHADGIALINQFVTSRRVVKISPVKQKERLTMSYTKSPEQQRFLRQIERQAWKYAQSQFMSKVIRAKADLSLLADDMNDADQFIFGSKGEILFSESDE